MFQAMVPIYDGARAIKGRKYAPNAPGKRDTHFQKEISKSGGGVWMKTHDQIKRSLEQTIDKHAVLLKKTLTTRFENIHKMFNTMCADKAGETPEEKEIRAVMLGFVQKAEDKYNQELLPLAKKFFLDDGEQRGEDDED